MSQQVVFIFNMLMSSGYRRLPNMILMIIFLCDWSRGSNFAQNSKCSESLQIEQARRPRRQEPNATWMGSNGHWMSEILRSIQIVKHAKNKLLTVQSVQLLTWQGCMLMWQGRTLTWKSWVGRQLEVGWSNHFLTHGMSLTSGMVPRGPDMGCHMAPYLVWFIVKIIWSLWGSNLGPPAWVERLRMVWVTNSPRYVPCYINGFIYI
jgi:hypothetical protein